ncbi:DMT family protein [Methylacidiphilum fumariolicum]|nr:DMT family protein [Candidatus Methylacidiphilum fumarolicum]MBW6414038.1 DMT family protein [Candidatus Methylacidiphilum fumarolicum]
MQPKKNQSTSRPMKTILLLIISNIFMTLAWYLHLKFRHKPLPTAIMMSWGLAFFEYIFQVPANRIGSYSFSVTQLKVLQECITLAVFTLLAWIIFKESPSWNLFIAYLLIIGAVFFAFKG